jgi:outer membrane protein assembly factor BamB
MPVVSLVVILSWLSVARTDNWPQWRGPSNNGVCREAKLPAEWGPERNIAWKLPLPGMGGATPIVWGERIFLTSADGNDMVLLCVGTKGKELWKRKLGTGGRMFRKDEGNEASASPSTDGKLVFAFAGTGDLACFDFEGQEVWHFNVQDRYGKFRIMHGMHSTPLLHGDRLYLALLHSGGMWVIALDKSTGKELWKFARKSDGQGEGEHSYASPCLWQSGKEAYLVVHGCDYTTAHRLDDGSEIWRLSDLNPKDSYNPTLRFVASPLAADELIVVPTAKNGPVIGVKPDASGTIAIGSPFELWRRPRGTPDVPSPLVHDGLVYLCRENGVLIGLDARTGKEHYEERLHNARYRASPVYGDGKLYLTARDGVFSVVKAGRKFELLATNRLNDTFTASPAISEGRIYLRGFDALYAVQSAEK